MRALISGVAGFLGSHLCDLLLAEGLDVVGVDNFLTGRPQNIAHFKDNPRFSFIEHDVTRPLKLTGPLDRVYHLACPSAPAKYARHQVATLRVNSEGTWQLLELAIDNGARFLFTSSSESYGDAHVHPQSETYWGNVNPIGLRSMYDESKRFGEACTMAYHRERGADTRIVRLFNSYGPRMDPADGRVVINFIMQALRSQPLTIHGDGYQTRSLVYATDVVRGIHAAMEGDFHEPINLGNPEEVTIFDLAREIRDLAHGSTSEIVHLPATPDDPKVRCPDISRARQLLGWTPTVARKVGLTTMIDYYRGVVEQ